MDEPTQAEGAAPDGSLPAAPATPPAAFAGEPPATPTDATAAAGDTPGGEPFFDGAMIQRGLLAWLGIIAFGGLGATLLGHADGALLFAGAGAFALAQATDAAAVLERYRSLVLGALPRDSAQGRLVRGLVRGLVSLVGATAYIGMMGVAASSLAGSERAFVIAWCGFGAFASLAVAPRRVADALTMRLMGGVGRTRRLTVRIAVIVLMLYVPAHALVPLALATVRESGQPLMDPASLAAQLAGEVAIALAGVGWLVRRRWSGVRRRLGLEALRPAHAAWIVGGLIAAVALNAVTEWAEKRWFLDLWRADSEFTKSLASGLTGASAVLLGISAGVGEEVAMRGALQPRLGIVLTSLLFACGHVQYSWYGIMTVWLLGMMLGAIRSRTNTTVVIVVHALYDIFAVLTT